ncbi:MAG: hypothetical protein V1736_04920 [Pseudomonadota bacterium]
MLVFISDIHLTDGSSGTTIDPRAFDKFCRMLSDIIGDPRKSNIKNVEIVLLGDIFDVIRSDLWLRPENDISEVPIRPWSTANETDRAGWNLRLYAEEIAGRITALPRNIEAVRYLDEFTKQCLRKDVKVDLGYLTGNHDWLINRFGSTRLIIAQFLGMPDPKSYTKNRFPCDRIFEEYGVLARHGDYYDNFNYEGDRDSSSLGDAIVIDLLSRFPAAVQADSVLGSDPGLVHELKEIDNVRPILAIPAWIQGICNYRPGVEERLHSLWNSLVDDFFKIEFVRNHDRFGPDMMDFLEMGMRLSSSFSFGKLREILGHWTIRHLSGKVDDYRQFAYNEAALKNNSVRYVVYGHTHRAEHVPLDIVPVPHGEVMEKAYFNTGTWRKVFEQTAFDQNNCEFMGWHVMTFVVFYLREEKEEDRNYEVWSASLGYGKQG